MSLDLEKQLVFYGAYHHNKTNILIHTYCVPLILATSFLLASNIPLLIPLPSWLSVPYLPLNPGTVGSFIWGGLYILLEPVAGTVLALVCVAMAAFGNYALTNFDPRTVNTYAGATFAVSWILQFIGHGKFERRAPALLDNLFQALFLAPLFVWLEVLFGFGYRQELHSRVEQGVVKALAKLQAAKEAKPAAVTNGNGKAQ